MSAVLPTSSSDMESAEHVVADPRAAFALPVLAMLEAVERHGNVAARLPVTRWPVTVGRALDADLVVDDTHVAAQHLRLEQDAPGRVRVHVLETRNGVSVGRQRHERGAAFDWMPGQLLALGRLQLRLRLADSPVPAEQALPRAAWRATALTVVAVALLMLQMLAQLWLKGAGTEGTWQEVPQILVGGLAILFLWSGLWAMASRVISHNAQFWRHVRIASTALVLAYALEFVMQVLAFAFSWEMLGRFAYMALVLCAAAGVYRHLVVAAPQSRRGIAVGVLLVLLVGVPTTLGSQWLKNRRISNQLYLAQFYPPSWRFAAPVPTKQFLSEAASLEQRLGKRLKDTADESSNAEEESDDE